jgi:hypothetical protein
MLLLAKILGFIFENPLGKLAAGGAALLLFVGGFIMHERNVGAGRVRAQIERQSDENIRKAQAVRGASERGDPDGMRDPHATR